MIAIKKSLEHMAWSTQRFLEAIEGLPSSIYSLKAAEGEWPIGQLLTHLAGSAEWYRYILTGTWWTDLSPVSSLEELKKLRAYMTELDAVLIAQGDLLEELVEYRGEHGMAKVHRSTILAQAVMHAAEHKGQIATLLKVHGFHLDLDLLDVWNFTGE